MFNSETWRLLQKQLDKLTIELVKINGFLYRITFWLVGISLVLMALMMLLFHHRF